MTSSDSRVRAHLVEVACMRAELVHAQTHKSTQPPDRPVRGASTPLVAPARPRA